MQETKRSLKVYFAGTYTRREYIRRCMNELEEIGFEIIADWTSHYDPTGKFWKKYAQDDLNGVRGCDIFCIEADPLSPGKYVELGAALILGKPIFVLNATPFISRSEFDEVKLRTLRNTSFGALVPDDRYFDSFYYMKKALSKILDNLKGEVSLVS